MGFVIITRNEDMEKGTLLLHGYRQRYGLHKKKRYLHRHCKSY